MAAEVEIVITGRDNASGAIGGVGGAFSNLGNIITGIKKSAIDLANQAFDAMVGVITPFINSASESEQAVARLDAILKATSGAAGLTSQQLQNMAGSLQGVTRFSDETILAGASLLLTFRNISGETFERTVPAMLDMAEIFGSVDSAAMQLGKALNDPVNMLGSLTRAGVTFTDAQKEMIKNFVETGDVAAAQNIILTEVEQQVGGLAVAMGDTFAGKLEILRNRFDEIREKIGTALLPVIESLFTKIEQWLPLIEDFGSRMADVFGPAFADLFQQLQPGIEILRDAMQQIAVDIGPRASEIFGVIADNLRQLGAEILPFLIDGFNTFAAWFKENGPLIGDTLIIFMEAFAGLVILARELWGVLEPVFSALLNMSLAVATTLMEILTGQFDWEGVGRTIVQQFINGIVGMLQSAVFLILSPFVNIINAVKALFGVASPSSVFAEIGRNLILGLMSGLLGMISPLLSLITYIVNLLLAPFQPILDLLGINIGSPGTPPPPTGGGTGGTGTGSGTVVNQYFAGATINVGSWDKIAYECMYPNPFVAATGGQLSGATGLAGGT